MRKVIYHPESITNVDDVVTLGESDFLLPDDDTDDDYILSADTPEGSPIPRHRLTKPESIEAESGEETAPEADSEPAPQQESPRDEAPAAKPSSPDPEQLREMSRILIEQAASEAARIIQDGHDKAKAERSAAMEEAKLRIEEACRSAREEAMRDALKLHSNRIMDCVKGIENAVYRLESAQAAFITGYENDLKWAALEIAERILCDVIEEDETRLAPLVMEAVRSARGASRVTVEISEQMVGLLSELQEQLKEAGLDDSVSLKLAPLPPGGCMIETPDKFIDASIPRQLENLKDYFKSDLH